MRYRAKMRPEASKTGLREIISQFSSTVKYMTMSEEEFMSEVYPYDVFTSKEMSLILTVLRRVPKSMMPKVCKEARRPQFVHKAELGTDMKFSEGNLCIMYRRCKLPLTTTTTTIINNLTVSADVLVRRFCSTAFVDQKAGHLTMVDSKGAVIVMAKWLDLRCMFPRPIRLEKGEKYTLTIMSNTGLVADNEGKGRKVATVSNNVKFQGMLHYTHLVIEFTVAEKVAPF